MIKIFLTGKTSFIGKNIFEYLSKFKNEYDIFAPTHSELDLTDEERVGDVLKKGKFDLIIHAAMYNQIFDHPNMMTESLRIFYNLEKYNEFYGKMYYFGSGAEFDKTIDIVSVKEEDFGRSIPKNYYGFAKYVMAKQTLKSSNIYNLRLFAVYGKYEDWKTKFISNAICRAILNLPVTISQNVVFDYMYIDDLSEIVKKFIHITPKYHHYNICTGEKIDLHTLARNIVEKNKKKSEIIIANEGLKPEYTASNKRMLGEVQYNFTQVDNGIYYLYDWYEKNIELINRDKL